jgi:hypothetical protein
MATIANQDGRHMVQHILHFESKMATKIQKFSDLEEI